ncbi:MAG: 3-dehydroquinate synthase, partial [Cyclobacteriaceae bacterium]
NVRVVIMVDDGLAAAQPDLINKIGGYFKGWQHVHVKSVIGGEAVKNSLDEVEKVLRAVNDFHIDRHSYVIGIGGGAVLDMVGFAAAIAHRGVRHIRIPTTVLSQNDSGVGVKNGINFFGKKNFIGTFAPPSVVINDVRFLHSLSQRDWRSGISEAIKVALLKDPDFFDWIEANANLLNERDEDAMEELIYRCAELHIRHISGSGDPFESGSSRPLDFGHWSAHRLEHLTDYAIRHGEAVAIGIVLDVCYAAEIGMIGESLRNRIIDLFKTLGFAIYHPDLGGSEGINDAIYRGLIEFQEHLGGILTITLIEGVGSQVDVHEIDRPSYDRAVAYLTKLARQ